MALFCTWTEGKPLPDNAPLYLHGLGHFHPETVIDNGFLETLEIGTTSEWILERVGIRRRRTVLPLDYIRQTKNRDTRAADEAATITTVEAGRLAASMALERAGLRSRDVGWVIAGGCAPDGQTPAESCRIAHALNIDGLACDIGAACASFGAQLYFVSRLAQLPDFTLIVNPEHTTRTVNYNDRSTAVLWGDASSAAVVSRTVPSRIRIVDSSFQTQPAGAGHVAIPRSGHFRQDGSIVQRFAIKTTLEGIAKHIGPARRRAKERGGKLRFVGHQANLLMLQSATERAELSATHWYNVDEYGNTGAAGAPSVLSQHWDELAAGDTVIVVVVGAGFSWATLRLEVDAI
jgi:3-oxoacyl-[acyl-carrier-protein] synthase-3